LTLKKKRTGDFEKYREHASQLEKLQETEKEGMRKALDTYKQQMKDLTVKLAGTLQMNSMLERKCKDYEMKFDEMTKTMQTSNECIDQFKEMKKNNILKQNKDLHTNLKDLMSKYSQLNAFNDVVKQSLETATRRNETLQNLCRGLQQQNNALKERLKQQGVEFNVPSSSSTLLPEPTIAAAPTMVGNLPTENILSESSNNNVNINEAVTMVGSEIMMDIDTNTDTANNSTNNNNDEKADPQKQKKKKKNKKNKKSKQLTDEKNLETTNK